jgi:hypothetical protein
MSSSIDLKKGSISSSLLARFKDFIRESKIVWPKASRKSSLERVKAGS